MLQYFVSYRNFIPYHGCIRCPHFLQNINHGIPNKLLYFISPKKREKKYTSVEPEKNTSQILGWNLEGRAIMLRGSRVYFFDYFSSMSLEVMTTHTFSQKLYPPLYYVDFYQSGICSAWWWQMRCDSVSDGEASTRSCSVPPAQAGTNLRQQRQPERQCSPPLRIPFQVSLGPWCPESWNMEPLAWPHVSCFYPAFVFSLLAPSTTSVRFR